MKHNIKITLILLAMFFITQMIGLAVIHEYTPEVKTITNQTTGQQQNITIEKLPEGFQPPAEVKPVEFLPMIIFSFVLAVVLIFVLMKFDLKIILRAWFFIVVIVALGLTLNAGINKILPGYAIQGTITYAFLISLIIAIPLAFFKIFRQNILIHNLTELLVYPGIAAVFVPILNLWTILILLVLISAYDIYAVWHAKFMQKMAKFQINQLKIFAGFFIPYADKKTKEKIRLLKEKYKNQKIPQKIVGKQKFKISLAILGGGDVVFPMIMAGVILRLFGFIPALTISIFATLSLLALFIAAKKGKFYPAMPFLTAGCFIGLLVAWLFFI